MIDFNAELVEAARQYIGKPAFYHPSKAGNCYEEPTERCWAEGLGPTEFDCSGLVLRSIADVLGVDVSDRPVPFRHVRDMWQAGQEQTGFGLAAAGVGSLVVTRREYTIDGQNVAKPGHMGIISRLTEHGLQLIHASAEARRVEESPLKAGEVVLGVLQFEPSAISLV